MVLFTVHIFPLEAERLRESSSAMTNTHICITDYRFSWTEGAAKFIFPYTRSPCSEENTGEEIPSPIWNQNPPCLFCPSPPQLTNSIVRYHHLSGSIFICIETILPQQQ